MAGRVAGKVALVTGAARGIGRACAERLADEGAIVFLTDVEDEAGAQSAAAITAAGGQARYAHQDVTCEEDWIAIVDLIAQRHGRLDILVNNAGVAFGGPLTEMSLESWWRQTAINIDGVFLGVKLALPLMRRSGEGGSIVNMSSTSGLVGSRNLAGYGATKGAVRLFSKSVAMECAAERDGIRCNSVHPGLIETPIWNMVLGGEAGARKTADSAVVDALAAQAVPLGYKGTPEDVASGVLYLASDESRYVTGTELVIDGGMSAR